MRTYFHDLQYALRTLHKTPGFVLTAVLSVGLGIGANTAIFSLLNTLMLRPLPVRDPQQLVRIGPVDHQGLIQPIPGPMFDLLRKEPLFEGLCGARVPPWTIEVKSDIFQITGHALSGDCYETLGIRPALGRLFTREDDNPNGPLVTVLSYAFWHNQLGGDPNVIGRTIRIQGAPFTIIGVTEPRFQGLLLGFPPGVSIPITQERADPAIPQKFYWGDAFGRMKSGYAAGALQSRLAVQWRRLLEQSLPPSLGGEERTEMLRWPVVVVSARTGFDYSMRKRFERPLFASLGISALVFLVSGISLANLLLARGLRQRREVAIRLALGARRWHIIRQIGAEVSILLAMGLGCALLLAYAGSSALLALLSRAFRGFALAAPPDFRVLAFTGAAALTAVLVFGLLPAYQTSAVNVSNALNSGTRSPNGRHRRARRFLICGQVGLTFVLLMGASFFVETLRLLRNQAIGFRVEGLMTMQLLPLPGGYSDGFNGSTYYRELLDSIQQLPGVQSACLSHFSPLFTTPHKQEVSITRMPDVRIEAPVQEVSDGFLATMSIPLLQGADFRRTDSPQTQKTAIVSESLAKRFFAAGQGLGQHIRVGSDKDTQDLQIIGVAADARLMDLHAQDVSFVYLNYWDYPDYQKWGDIQLRYSGDPAALISAVRLKLRQAGHEFPMYARTIADQRDVSLLQEMLLASLGTVFGLLALTLAGVGLFGLLSFFVTSRTGEIGVRRAIGADYLDVGWLILREALVLVGAGLLAGLPLSYATLRLLSTILYGTTPALSVPLLFSLCVLLGIGCVAAVLPVWRALELDPMAALRYE